MTAFYMMKVQSEEEMSQKKLICYTDINCCTWAIVLVEQEEVVATLRIMETFLNYDTEQNLMKERTGNFPSDEE